MKFVIIGLGSMGKRRIRIIKSLRPNDIIIGVDNNKTRCNESEEKFGITCYSSITKANLEHNFDCAFICTSPLSHGEIINQCLNYSWNVFTEINLSADFYQENCALANKKGLVLFLSSTPMYKQEMQFIYKEVNKEKGPFNYIYHVGQYLPDWHPWEAYNSFFVGDVKSNGCREIMEIELPWMTKVFGKIIDISVVSDKMSDLDINFKDNYLISISHENGTKGIFAVDVISRKAVRHLEIYNDSIYITWDGKPETLQKLNLQNNKLEAMGIDDYNQADGYSEFINEVSYINETRYFFEVLNGKPLKYSFEEDLDILKIIDKIEQY